MRRRDTRNPPDSSKTLEQLEGDVWGAPEYDSNLVLTIHALRRKPIAEFTIEDLRITLGQQLGVVHLMPLALERLEADPFAEGRYYPGDLLGAVMGIPSGYWSAHPAEAARIATVVDGAAQMLESRDVIDEIKAHLRTLMAAAPWRLG